MFKRQQQLAWTLTLLGLLAGVECRAQFELKRGSLNQLYVAAASVPGTGSPSITTPQFRAIQVTSAASSARAVSGSVSTQYPAAIYRSSYPSGAATGVAMVLVRSSLGGAFASGVPRYLFADVIYPPLAREGGSTTAEVGYWRPWPVQPGETFSQPGSSSVGTPVRLTSIRLDGSGSGYTSAPTVSVSGGGGAATSRPHPDRPPSARAYPARARPRTADFRSRNKPPGRSTRRQRDWQSRSCRCRQP